MKKYFVLIVILLASLGTINAQAEGSSTTPTNIRPVTLKQLYDIVQVDMNQFKVLKTFYGDTNENRLNQLRNTTDEEERAAIEQEALVLLDEKIRSLLNSAQLARYNQLQQPDATEPGSTVDPNGAEPGGGGQ